MSLSETMDKLEHLVTCISKDLIKVAKGNRSAAQRIRVGTIRLEKVGKQFRKESVAAERKPKRKIRKRKR